MRKNFSQSASRFSTQKYDECLDKCPSIGFEKYLAQNLKTFAFFTCMEIHFNVKKLQNAVKLFMTNEMYFFVVFHVLIRYLWFCESVSVNGR